MPDNARAGLTTRVLLSAWAFITLTLFFTVILLAGELTSRGQNPLDIAFKTEEPPPPHVATTSESSSHAKEIQLRFADADGCLLTAEPRRVELTDHIVDNCKVALIELLKGPKDGLTPLFPPIADPVAGVRAVYLVAGGELIVDLAHEILPDAKIASASSEALLVYGVVNTLAQPELKGTAEDEAIARVRFLVDGSPPTDAFPIHLDLSRPVVPDNQWNTGAESQQTGHG